MKIALIMVKGDSYSFKKRPFVMKHVPDSLALGMLYAIIKNAFPDIEVEIYDETIEVIKKEKINADIIGISAITPALHKAIALSEYFRSKNIPVFLGGSHATLAPETCTEYFDSVVSGLANETLVELINDFKNNKLKKLYKQRKDMSFENFVFPARDIYEKKDSWSTELYMVQATYGCSNVCKFCVQPYVCQGYHQRPVKDVIEEIKTIKSNYIEFVDPNFAKDINYLTDLCFNLRHLQKRWFAPMTMAITNNEDYVQMIKIAGCSGVLIGFESLNFESIDTISKGFNNIKKYKTVVDKFHKYGIEVTGSFVMGLDGDTKNTLKNTLDFIIDAGIDFVRFTINTPFPGTEYYKEMKKEGRLLTEDYRFYDCCHCVIKPANMSAEDVETMFKTIWKKAYSFVNIIRRLSRIKPITKRIRLIVKNYIFGKLYISMNMN